MLHVICYFHVLVFPPFPPMSPLFNPSQIFNHSHHSLSNWWTVFYYSYIIWILYIYIYELCVYAILWVHLVWFCVDGFNPEHFILDNKLRVLTIVETNSPSLSSHSLPIVLGLLLEPCDLSIDIIIVQVLFRQPYCWSIMGISSLSFLEDTLSQWICWSSRSYNLSILSSMVFPEPWV